MEIRIAANIRAMRKERKLTQEQLAEVFGVTVGAVSKWESGASVPDVSLIMELADFFETSVDVLLGYEKADNNLKKLLEQVRLLRNEKKFDDAAIAAEKALAKYPNHFEVNYKCAIMYCIKGVERKEKKSYSRSLELFERALELMGQNTNEQVNEWTIRNHIAKVYLCLEQTDKALEVMKKNNAAGLNNYMIGFTLATGAKKPDEALPYLSDALIEHLTVLMSITLGYFAAYVQKQEFTLALDVATWMLGLLYRLKKPGEVTYLEREAVQLLCCCALASALEADSDKAAEYLRQARDVALEYDAAPSSGFQQMRFSHSTEQATAFDDFGATAYDGITNFVEQDKENKDALGEIWHTVRQEEQPAGEDRRQTE